MRLYLAAPWAHKASMEDYAKQFEVAGHTITHKWWKTDDIAEGTNRNDDLREQAENDFDGVTTAQALVLFNLAKSEGKAVEQGIALAHGLPIIAIGKLGALSLNVFHYMPEYTWVDTVEEAINACKSIEAV